MLRVRGTSEALGAKLLLGPQGQRPAKDRARGCPPAPQLPACRTWRRRSAPAWGPLCSGAGPLSTLCSNQARTPQLLLCPGRGLPASGQRLLQGHPRSALCGCWLWSPAPSQGRQTEVTPGTALSLRVTATRGEEGPSLLSPAPQTIHIPQSPDPSRQQGPLRVLEGKLRHVRPQHEHAASD